MSIDRFPPSKADEMAAFIAANPVHHIDWRGPVAYVFTGDDIPVVQRITRVDRLQIRGALDQLQMRSAIEAYVAAGNQRVKDWWLLAGYFEIDNEMVLAAQVALGLSDEQKQAIWDMAATL